MKQATIDFQIEELLLRDVPYAQRISVAAAVEEELTRLITEHGLPPELAAGGNIPHIGLDPIPITTQTKPDIIGAHIAQHVYQALHSSLPKIIQHSSPHTKES